MDIQAEKLDLIRWLTEVTEPAIIKSFIALRKQEQGDWWDEISETEKEQIADGLTQADNGELIAHKEVMAKYQKWLSK